MVIAPLVRGSVAAAAMVALDALDRRALDPRPPRVGVIGRLDACF